MKPKSNQPHLNLLHKMLFALVASLAISSLLFFQTESITGAATGVGSGSLLVSATIEVTSANITSSDLTRNGTIDNVSAVISTQNSNSEVYTWYRNGSSIMDLNMPFEKVDGTSSDNAKDYSPNGYDGTENGNPIWNASGGFDGNGSYEFDGSSDFLSFTSPTNVFSASEGTWMFWFYSNAAPTGNGETFMAAYTWGSVSNIQRMKINGSSFRFLNKGSSTNYRGYIDIDNLVGNWHHLALTGGPNGNKVFLNGEEVSPTYTTGSSANTQWLDDLSENTLQLSGHRIGIIQEEFFNGSLDDLRIYNVQLTADQINTIYNNQSAIIDSSQTKASENWSYCVTPNDANDDGATVCSDNLTVIEHIPTITSNLINTTDPFTNSSTANVTNVLTVTDPTNDPIKLIYDWRINESSIAPLILPMERINATNTSNAKDYSQYDIQVEEQNGVIWNATGGFDGNGSYEFDGEDDYLNISNVEEVNLSTSLTLMFWMTTHEDIDVTEYWGMQMLGRGTYGDPDNTMDLRIRAANDEAIFNYEYGAGSNANYAIATTELTDGNWHHVAATWTGSRCLIYTDGQLEGNVSCTNTPGPFNESWFVGKSLQVDGLQANFSGSMDDIYIFNKSLSTDQIQAMYNDRPDLIVSQETSGADNWTLCVTANDGDENSASVCSQSIEINGVPTTPVVVSPTNDSSRTNRSVDFIWNNSVDANTNDNIQYDFQLFTSSDLTGELINTSSLPTDNVNDSNYTYFSDLAVDDTFYFRIRADDSKEQSAWTDLFEFNVLSSNVISLPINNITFGLINSSEDKNTTMSGFQPIVLSNDGNIPLNISINTTQMFTSQNSLWQCQIQANETNAYLSANESWFNFTVNQNATTHIWALQHENDSNTANRANIHSLVHIAEDESGGSKSSSISIYSEASD